MTQKQAIDILRNEIECVKTDCERAECRECDLVMREGDILATLGMAIDALEKQIPRAVIYEGDGYADGEMVYDVAHCPTCDACFEDRYNWKVNFCPNCGQRLDWSVGGER